MLNLVTKLTQFDSMNTVNMDTEMNTCCFVCGVKQALCIKMSTECEA